MILTLRGLNPNRLLECKCFSAEIMDMQKIIDDRGWATSLRRNLPPWLVKPIRNIVFKVASIMPENFKYWLAGKFQNKRYPYSIVKEGDKVVQVGAPRDILKSGRSRAIHFARKVGPDGRVLVVEPDLDSANELKSFARRNHLENRIIIVNKGAWKERALLKFIVNPEHPATNRLEAVAWREKNNEKEYEKDKSIAIEVDSLANILQAENFPPPDFVSITTNGAEEEIVEGLWGSGIINFTEYISLAPPRDNNISIMKKYGYNWLALDDRGQLFKRSDS